MSGFAFHPEAFTDLADIWGFIAEDNVDAADTRPDLTDRPLRFLLVRDYLVAYSPEESPLWVIAVLHGRRNPRIMAAVLRARE